MQREHGDHHGSSQVSKMVGTVRFELTTSCTPSKRATKLRYVPNHSLQPEPERAAIVNAQGVNSITFRRLQTLVASKAGSTLTMITVRSSSWSRFSEKSCRD